MAQLYKPNEMMTIAAARALRNDDVCFVGIGMPSAACNLARLTPRAGHHADLRVRHASPPSRACCRSRSATANCATPRSPRCRCRRCSATGCRAGASRVGFLGGAQIDRFANLNTTVVGPYDKPKVRLPGGGGAPEIAVSCGEIFIIMAQGKRSFVGEARFRHLDRPRRGRRPPRAARAEDQGADQARHRPLRLRAGPGDQGNDGDVDPSRRDARADRREHRLAGALRRAASPRPRRRPRDELAVLRELHARTALRARRTDGVAA